MAGPRVAVVVISIGNRPWFPIVRHWLGCYCDRCGFELIVHTEPLFAQPRIEEFDRYQNFGRLQKLGIGRHFAEFDRVIQIDDTCMISPGTPNLADLVPENKIGCWIEGKARPGEQFQRYLATHQKVHGRQTKLSRERFFNSGVGVYGSQHAALFDVSSEALRSIMRDQTFSDQGYLSHAAEQNGFELQDLGPSFNLVGSVIRSSSGPEPLLDRGIHIFHLTASIAQYRMPIAEAIDRAFRRRWPA